jgi:hypothetical protein
LNSYNHYKAGPDDPDPWGKAPANKPDALRYAEHTIDQQWKLEQRYFENYDSDEVISDAPAYLEQSLRECRKKDNPASAVKEEREKRKSWYDLMLCKNLYPIYTKSSLGGLLKSANSPKGYSLHGKRDAATYTGVLVVPNNSDKNRMASRYNVRKRLIYHVKEFATAGNNETSTPTPTDYGIELPAPLLMCEYPNGSEYLLIPWSSGLCCQGPFKTKKPYRVCCKHEAYAALVLAHRGSIFLPIDKGIDVPARARRFIDPAIAANHTPKA